MKKYFSNRNKVIFFILLCLPMMSAQAAWLFNFGGTASGNWNNAVDENDFTVQSGTFPQPALFNDTIIDDAGSSFPALDLEIFTTVGYTALAPKTNTDTHSEDWLTTGASQNAMYLNAVGSTIRLRLQGLTAGNYSLELFAFTDSAAYQHDSVTIQAGSTGGSLSTTTSDFNTSNFDAGGAGADSQDKLAKWSSITIGTGEDLEILITGTSPNETPLINAFEVALIPEPSTMVLVGIVLGTVVLFRRRR